MNHDRHGFLLNLPCLAVCILLIFIYSAHANANVDPVGLWRGTAVELISCTDGRSGRRDLTTEITVTVEGGQFTGSQFFTGTEVFDGVTSSFSNMASPLVGTVSADGVVTSAYQSTPVINLSGRISGDRWTSNYEITVPGSPTCTFTLTQTWTRNSVFPQQTASAIISTGTTVATSARVVSGLQQNRVRSIFSGRATGASEIADGFMLQAGSGLNASDGYLSSLGVWFSYSYTNTENTLSSTAFDSERNSYLGGLDYMFNDSVLVGLSFGYEHADVDTTFNDGMAETNGYTIAPYAAVTLHDKTYLDFSAGYSSLNTDQNRQRSTAPVSSSFDSQRLFISGNLNHIIEWKKLYITGSLGFLWAREKLDSFVESDATRLAGQTFELRQWRSSIDVTYSSGNFEPYFRGTYENDMSVTQIAVAGGLPQPSNDNDNFILAAGIRYYASNGFSVVSDYSHLIGRDNLDESSFNLLLRLEF